MPRSFTTDALKQLKARLKGKPLTARTIDALRPASAGTQYDINDSSTPGFAVRVSDQGKRTYVLVARYPGSANPTRRALGEVGAISLESARAKARKWIELVKRGIDPKVAEEGEKAARIKADATTFAAVAERYLARPKMKAQRTAADTRRIFDVELIGKLGARPIAAITKGEVQALLQAIVDRPAKRTAQIAFQHLGSLFKWAIKNDLAEASPTDRIDADELLGDRQFRDRVLDDDEVGSLWRGCNALGHPFGKLFQVLLLTGARLTEISEARWSEIDKDRTVLSIPASRYKTGKPHDIPLSADARALLGSLPKYGDGYLFSTTNGTTHVNYGHRAKARLAAMMATELGREVPHWTLHDLRRTLATNLQKLGVALPVTEAVLGHVSGSRAGIVGIYQRHNYADEKRDALELWAMRLRSIVTPPTPGVVHGKFGGNRA